MNHRFMSLAHNQSNYFHNKHAYKNNYIRKHKNRMNSNA